MRETKYDYIEAYLSRSNSDTVVATKELVTGAPGVVTEAPTMTVVFTRRPDVHVVQCPVLAVKLQVRLREHLMPTEPR